MKDGLTLTLRRCAAILSIVLLGSVALSAWAQALLQLGDMSYARVEAPYLRMPVSSAPRFFRGVGGVAFSAVAEGVDGLQVTSLKYDATAADGRRLLVELQRGPQKFTVRPSIFDWQLVPIARFAKDENGSAMTLFGQLKNKAQEREVLSKGDRIINYHPAIDNTLLGQRLFQADVMIIQPNAVHVFRDGRGLLFGAGESKPDVARNMRAFRAISMWQEERATRGERYQSYVVGDIDQAVRFDLRDGVLKFTGRPYWAAWRSRHPESHIRSATEKLIAPHDAKIERYNGLVNEFNAKRSTAPNSVLRDLDASITRLQREIEEDEKRIEAAMDEINAVEQMPEYSRTLSGKIAAVSGINPLVYQSVTNTMHYRSLFKHFQRRQVAAYSAFVDSMKEVEPSPKVVTPTIQQR
jgi:hypothetical protein